VIRHGVAAAPAQVDSAIGESDRAADLAGHRTEPAGVVPAVLGVEGGPAFVPAQARMAMVHTVQVEAQRQDLQWRGQFQVQRLERLVEVGPVVVRAIRQRDDTEVVVVRPNSYSRSR
jgi:hypothetical protein